MKSISWKWAGMTLAGAVLGAVVVYQLQKHTTGIVDDD